MSIEHLAALQILTGAYTKDVKVLQTLHNCYSGNG